MSSEARIVANRLNAQKSTGPRTAEGKAAVAQNAVKHGLSAQCDVIRGEDQKEFNQYREELFWELNPAGVMQSRLTERIVSLAWRLRRAERLQNEAFDALLAKETSSPLAMFTRSLRGKEQDKGESGGCDGDPALAQTVVRDFANSRVLDRLLMYERRIESSLYRTMNELQKLQRTQDQEPGKGANVSKASRPWIEVEGGLRIAGGTPATQPPADRGFVTSSAKQSQSPPGDGVHGTAYESGDASPGEETPDGVTTNASDCAEQSQATMGVSRQEDPGSTPPASDFAIDGSNVPSAIPTSAVCETRSTSGIVVNEAKLAVQRSGGAKQSQRPASAAALTPIAAEFSAFPGGIGKAEGFADGGWASHRQAGACRCHPKVDDTLRETHVESV